MLMDSYEGTYCKRIPVNSTSQAHGSNQGQTSDYSLESHKKISYNFPSARVFLLHLVYHRQSFLTVPSPRLVLIMVDLPLRLAPHRLVAQ